MTVVRRIARPMMAAIFVTNGLDSLRHPAKPAQVAAPVIKALAGPLNLPDDPELMVRANGATMLVAGTMLGLGKFPRLAAIALAATLVPATYAAHAFWAIDDPAAREQQKTHFLKNVGLLGGVLLASVDTAGKPGLAYRARRAGYETRRQTALAKREARHAAMSARRGAKSLVD
jgi:putative oxidoreductase